MHYHHYKYFFFRHAIRRPLTCAAMGFIVFENGLIPTSDAMHSWFPGLFWGPVDGEQLIEDVEYRISQHALEDVDTATI
jgi:hypothetical protein